MLGMEKLTQKALEQHDKIHPNFQAPKSRTSNSKDDKPQPPAMATKTRPRLPSCSESTSNDTVHPRPFERQPSKASLLNAKPKPGMAIFRVVAAARAWKRLSQRRLPAVPEKPKVKLENTFRLGPEPEEAFKPERVKAAIRDVLTSFLKRFHYTPDGSRQMSLVLTNEIKLRVKAMNFPRYKVVCHVLIMQNKGQGVEVSSRCVWNHETDSFASYTHKTPSVICVGNVHAVYFE